MKAKTKTTLVVAIALVGIFCYSLDAVAGVDAENPTVDDAGNALKILSDPQLPYDFCAKKYDADSDILDCISTLTYTAAKVVYNYGYNLGFDEAHKTCTQENSYTF